MPIVSLNGQNIYCDVTGSGDPLLLLHGLGSSGRDWEEQVPAFSTRYQVITPDLIGFGRSSKLTQACGIPEFAGQVFALLEYLQIDRCHVLGFSMGGAVAFQMATDFPERIRSLIILNSLPSFLPDTLSKQKEFLLRRIMVRLFGLKSLGRIMARRLLPRDDQLELRNKMAGHFADNDKKSYLIWLNALSVWSVTERLGTLSMPVLLISADHDYTPIDDKRKYLEQIPNAQLKVVENSRHLTPIDQARAFNRMVMDFLAELPVAKNDRS